MGPKIVKSRFTSLGMASVLLLAWVVAAGAVRISATTTQIGVTGRANANASIASSGSFVGIVWTARTKDGVTDVYAATSRDAGRSFRAPVRVNQVAGEASVSGEQPPRIALVPRRGAGPSIVVLWTAKSSSGTRLLSARSADAGQSFGPAAPVPGSEAAGNRGWESMAIGTNGDPWRCGWITAKYPHGQPATARAARTTMEQRTTRRPTAPRGRSSRKSSSPG